VDDSRYNPAIDPAFSSWSNYYWSGSTCAGLPTIAWEVTFDYGSVNLTVKSHTAGVRCVRGGPGGSLGHLDITEPDGDEVLVKGQEYTITWDRPNITGDIQIDLYKGGTEPQFMVVQLAAAAPNTGQYEFFIPDYLVGGTDYRIGISAQNGQVWNFSSMNFTITPLRSHFRATSVMLKLRQETR
jgi:hypothetical protein